MSLMVGIQIGAISFVDEGVGNVLDTVAEKGAVNTVFVNTHGFDRGVAGRQTLYRPWPGHGPESKDDLHLGGSFLTPHEEHYGGTVLKPHRAADAEVAGFDVLAEVTPAAKERGMGVYAFLLENTHSGLSRNVPNWPKVLQVDAWGRADAYACLRNPDYVNWWLSIIEEHVGEYEGLDGIMWGSERNGPLDNAISEGGFARNGNPYCFCRWCVEAGEREGIDVRRAREGYLELDRLCNDSAPDVPVGDSAFIRFLRLLGAYPEIIAWDQLWYRGYEEFQARIYGTAKFLAPGIQVGWHVWHHNSFSPWYRSQVDFDRMSAYSDFVKPVLYNNCAGYRLHHYIKNVTQRIFRGVPEQTVFDLFRHALGYDEAIAFEDLPGTGLSPDYVRRETRRTVAAVGGRASVYPGIDVNVPTPDHVFQTTPIEVRKSVAAALDGGADGLLLSRKYSEMTFANLEAAGDEVRGWSASNAL
ncbi:hypothetical protein [Microbacterium tumbae]